MERRNGSCPYLAMPCPSARRAFHSLRPRARMSLSSTPVGLPLPPRFRRTRERSTPSFLCHQEHPLLAAPFQSCYEPYRAAICCPMTTDIVIRSCAAYANRLHIPPEASANTERESLIVPSP